MADAMTAPTADSDSGRLKAALRQVLRRYYGQIRARPALSIPALVLPGIGDVLIFYAPPLVVARLLGAFEGLPRPINIGVVAAGQAANRGPADVVGDRPHPLGH